MPVDRRRIRGPDESHSPYHFISNESLKSLASGDRRLDESQRGPSDLRPIFARCGLISQAKGSAYIEAGNTKIICSVYGPREADRRDETDMKSGRLVADMRFAPFACHKRGAWVQGNEEKDMSQGLLESLRPGVCLHKYPRSQIDVCVMVLESDGPALSHAVTCASLALADAGIEMYDLVLGCTVRHTGTTQLLDPTLAEVQDDKNGGFVENQGSVTVSLMPNMNQVSGLQSDGVMEQESLKAAVQACIEGCYKLYPVIQQTLLKTVRKKAPPSES
ncbi:exosome complex component MTR3 [Alosa alosa]|uniref:exosome complex component MTR3 n=1 Tax=Alosa sapidissima TaxID=34773 RepID=UPI001C09F56E|nr:exosome complex component MTR3 [Alosa sapidissima]XP_048112800.1 exosome complex component MTR3 [Alosa alosa]